MWWRELRAKVGVSCDSLRLNGYFMKKLVCLFTLALLSIARAGSFDAGFYYYLSTEFEGANRVLDVVNDGKANDQVVLAKKGDFSGQLWKLTPEEGGFYRLTNQWKGSEFSLDVVNDGKNNNKLALAKSDAVTGQLWKLTPAGDGSYRLTTQWRGAKFSLDVYNDAEEKSSSLILAPTDEVTGQYWKVTKSAVPVK